MLSLPGSPELERLYALSRLEAAFLPQEAAVVCETGLLALCLGDRGGVHSLPGRGNLPDQLPATFRPPWSGLQGASRPIHPKLTFR